MSDVVSMLGGKDVIVTGPPLTMNAKIKGVFKGSPLWDVLTAIASQVSPTAQVTIRGDVFFIGDPDESDLASRVFTISGASPDTVLEAIKAAGTRLVSAVPASSDKIVVRDTERGLERIASVLEQVQAVSGQWVVDVRIVELSNSAAQQFGLDWEVTGSLLSQAAASAGAAPSIPSASLAQIQVAAILQAAASSTDVRQISSVRLHVIEGQSATMQVGDTIPVARRTVSPEGTSTVVEHTQINTGVQMSVGVRTVSADRYRLILDPEISDVIGTVDGAPILARRRLTTQAVVQVGEAVIVGGLQSAKDNQDDSGGLPGLVYPPFIGKRESSKINRRVYIIARLLPPTGTPADVTAPAANPPAAIDHLAD